VQIKAAPKAPARKPAASVTPVKETAGGAPKAASPTRRRARPAAAETTAADEGRIAARAEPSADEKKGQAIDIVVSTVEQLVAERGGEGSISASLIKNTIKRIRPGFSESEYGYSAFGKILDDAQKKGALVVERKEGGAVMVSLPPPRI
jgi:flagellar capping protein FliD